MAADYDGCDPYASKGRVSIILQLEGSFKNAHDKGEVEAFSSDQAVLVGQVIARDSGKRYFLSQELFSFEPFCSGGEARRCGYPASGSPSGMTAYG